MNWIQKEINLKGKRRGFHLITDEIISNTPEIKNISKGLINIFLKHTSASLSINENVSPDVRRDMERHFNKMVPENAPYFEHKLEGADDMPAHLKTVILGNSLTIPVTKGQINLGTWQGIYLNEHRNNAHSRELVITILGE